MVMSNLYIADEETFSSGETIEYLAENYFHEEQFYEDIFENDYEFDKELGSAPVKGGDF